MSGTRAKDRAARPSPPPPVERDAAAESPPVALPGHWRALVENVPDTITEIDAAARILLTNRSAAGLAPTERVGTSLYDYVPRALRDVLRAAIDEAFRSGDARSYETRVRDGAEDGGDAWWLTRIVPVDAAPGERHAILISTELTARKRVEERLRDSEERLSLALEATQVGVWDWQVPSGRAVYSASWASMLGYMLDEIAPQVQSWRNLVHPDDLLRAEAALEAHFAGEAEAYEAELRMRTKGGAWKWVRTQGRVVSRDADGAPLRMIGTHRDVDDERRATAEREHLIRDLTAALTHVKTLSGLIPICGACKKIRDDRGYWQQLEAYLAARSDAQFSHGLCPVCAERMRIEVETGHRTSQDDEGGGEG